MPVPARAFHEIAGRGSTRTGSAPRMKRHAANENGVKASSPKRIIVKLRPQVAAISSEAAMCRGRIASDIAFSFRRRERALHQHGVEPASVLAADRLQDADHPEAAAAMQRD